MKRLLPVLACLPVCLLFAGGAQAHPERATSFPSIDGKPPAPGGVPTYRSRGPSLVVCKPGSRAALKTEFSGRTLRSRLKTLHRCRYGDIQDAVNHAKSGDRILIMPGLYQEMPSRRTPVGAYHEGPCANDYVITEGFSNDAPPPVGPRSNDPPVRPDRNFQVNCPNSKNLVEVVGDTSHEVDPTHPSLPKCLQLCNLQIEGLGKDPQDVLLQGDRKKLDVLRIDRAWGIYLRNFAVEQSAFNGIDLVEVNGFRISKVVAREDQDYGILSFTSTNGLYDHVTAYDNGDSGIYPGSTEKGCDVDPNVYGTCGALAGPIASIGNGDRGCTHPSIEIRESDSYDNTLGYSGTAGNSTYVHDNDFHDNAAGLSTDSFAAGHPGMPQECVHWTGNRIHDNNHNIFTDANQKYCAQTPFPLRAPDHVCPQFQVPVGTGILIAGGNRNLIDDNHIYGNWRDGVMLFGVPATLRGDNTPAHQDDTSNGNRILDNDMGDPADGGRNGTDITWDSQGAANCFAGNALRSPTTPSSLPKCPGNPIVQSADVTVLGPMISCAAWDPVKMPDPPGCDWFTTPRKPS